MGREFEEICDELNDAWAELEALLKRFHVPAKTFVGGQDPSLALAFKNGTIRVETDRGPQPIRSASLELRMGMVRAVPALVRELEAAERARLDTVAEAVDSLRGLVAGLKAGRGAE